jgi:hypothetical protein
MKHITGSESSNGTSLAANSSKLPFEPLGKLDRSTGSASPRLCVHSCHEPELRSSQARPDSMSQLPQKPEQANAHQSIISMD